MALIASLIDSKYLVITRRSPPGQASPIAVEPERRIPHRAVFPLVSRDCTSRRRMIRKSAPPPGFLSSFAQTVTCIYTAISSRCPVILDNIKMMSYCGHGDGTIHRSARRDLAAVLAVFDDRPRRRRRLIQALRGPQACA